MDFMLSPVTVTSIERLARLKRGPCHSLSSSRVSHIHREGLPSLSLPQFYFRSSPAERRATQGLTHSAKWAQAWHRHRSAVCRMVVAQLNFWTCHLAFLQCNSVWTRPAFVSSSGWNQELWTLGELFLINPFPPLKHSLYTLRLPYPTPGM